MKTCPECYSEYDDQLERCPADSTPLKMVEADKDPLVGTRLGDRYEIVSVIGRGGMGVVYKARQEQMDKLMAIKMLHSHMVSDSEAVKRFYREAKTVSQVRHHHIVTLYDFGMSAQGQPFLVMDYLEGVSLKDELKRNGPLSFERADRIFSQINDALASAHALDVVHRDLKPENILLSSQNQTNDWITLVDFGLSKLKEPKTQDAYQITRTGDVCGSPPYMSPEQCLAASAVDPRSDIYSLAVVVYESLSGALPYQAKSAIEMMDCHLYGTPIPFSQSSVDLKVCTELTNFFIKALAKEPDVRHQTIVEFGADLHECLARDGIKLKSYKHRMEKASFKDMESEAEALMTGSYSTLGMSTEQMRGLASQRAIDIAKSTQSDLAAMQATGTRDGIPNVGAGRNENEDNRTWISRIMSAVFGPRQKEEDQVELSDSFFNQGLGYSNCPYCNAPVRSLIKFCISCQRQLPSAAEYARMRMSGSANKLSLPRTQNENGRRARPGFSSRAKETMNRNTYPIITKALSYCLVGAIIYVGYSCAQNPDFIKTMQRIMHVIKQ
ncbi:MAG: serine/threonine protein kinase [Cyanobacteria bacterium SZAS LIN-2]|nr:serine/threonine protein kinase [Cyanobacteria bacterium SZAS LIN-2]